MILINSIWKQYFTNHHEGLGTTYERFILHQHFKKIQKDFKIKNVIESPSFGMTGVSGINSMWWPFNDYNLTIVDHDNERIDLIKKIWEKISLNVSIIDNQNGYASLPFDDNLFDMGWNFAALWCVSDLKKFLNELIRVSRKVIFLCIPNSTNIFHLIRSFSGENSEVIRVDNTYPSRIHEIMENNNWKIYKQGYLDIPPWPDIAMKKEDLLRKIGLKRLAEKFSSNEDNYLCILDFFSKKNENMEKEILKYGYLENFPEIFQKFWAHHQYFLFVPEHNNKMID